MTIAKILCNATTNTSVPPQCFPYICLLPGGSLVLVLVFVVFAGVGGTVFENEQDKQEQNCLRTKSIVSLHLAPQIRSTA